MSSAHFGDVGRHPSSCLGDTCFSDVDLPRADSQWPGIHAAELENSRRLLNSEFFEVTLLDAVGAPGSLTLCGTHWDDSKAALKLCLVVAGVEVWCRSVELGLNLWESIVRR